DILTSVYLMEALGYACTDNGLTFAILSQMLSIQPAIQLFGSESLKENYLTRLAAGAHGAFAITEEDSGSDTYSLKATATRVAGGYVLNGRKRFITLAPVADLALVFATVDAGLGQWGVTGFVIDRGQDGFSTTETQPKMGLRTTPIGDIVLDNCFVPDSQRLGEEGAGVGIFNKAMESERSYILAGKIGAMQRQLEDTVRFVKSRKQFDTPISQFQSVANRVADMKLRLETSRMLLYKVAWLQSEGKPVVLDAALANLHLSETFVESSIDAVRNHGARGYLSEYEVERELRDSIGGLIYSGTSDIQRNIIARMLGL
ncbi:MAG: acyl-CoA dehydrogenase family protein, partial [Gammaproteobacteria bacterium]|nr:acyl-CoA dehydrogenase family protein [Gammaproteobacteria bacterium]